MVYKHEPYTITLTITVSDEDMDGVWVASEDGSTVFGDGLTPYWAVLDFLQCKSEIMRELIKSSPRLGKALQEEFGALMVWAEGRRR